MNITSRKTMAAALISWLFCLAAAAQVPPQISPNTQLIQGSFRAYDPATGFHTYGYQAFYEPTGNGVAGQRIFLLPAISFDDNSVAAEDSSGQPLDPSSPTQADTLVRVHLNYRQLPPARSEKTGIVAAILGTPLQVYQPVARPPFGLPLPPQVQQRVVQDVSGYNASLQAQVAAENAANGYAINLVSPQDLTIQLMINDDVVVERRFPGNLLGNGQLPPLSLDGRAPIDVRQRIRNGDLSDVLVRFQFQDSSLGSVQATFDSQQIINNFVHEFQQQVSSASSMGFDFFIFSHRDTIVRQSLTSQLQQNLTNVQNSKFAILMDNATEDQISLFEHNFFPDTTANQAITDHLKAAADARTRGDQALAKAHEDYAKFLQTGDKQTGINAVAAAAALASGDVLDFLASGVRFSSSNVGGNVTYNRVVQTSAEIDQHRRWSDVRRIDAVRSVVLVPQRAHVPDRTYAGVCGSVFNVQFPMPGIPGQGILVTCVANSSPVDTAGIVPGDIIGAINNNPCTSNPGGSPSCLDEITNISKIGQPASFWLPLRNATTQVLIQPGD
ncbi:hypothetical protein [Burkholderia pseudomallei]|uniref:hypothetical protein n=1 Tax=Burkholderia pseudomallei TaxID=28450 RepID=UPI0011773990|nr:hypothetical protein [Burkholderia pseudomallei]